MSGAIPVLLGLLTLSVVFKFKILETNLTPICAIDWNTVNLSVKNTDSFTPAPGHQLSTVRVRVRDVSASRQNVVQPDLVQAGRVARSSQVHWSCHIQKTLGHLVLPNFWLLQTFCPSSMVVSESWGWRVINRCHLWLSTVVT